MPLSQEKSAVASLVAGTRRIILAESDLSYRDWLANSLRDWGYDPCVVSNYRQMLSYLQQCSEQTVVLMDEGFGDEGLGGLTSLAHLMLDGVQARPIFCSDQHDAELEARVLQMGAAAFVARREDLQSLKRVVASVVGGGSKLNQALPLLGESAAVRELRDVIRHVAATDSPVMITGESGTGKELVARAIHDCSRRARQEFVPVNMAALPESLIESMLFGHEKGAFTGADQRQGGLCEHADGGSLFLDEICEMPLSLQPKLLRFLQSYRVQRVGSASLQHIDARIISATNRNVDELVAQGLLRSDLYFRLHVIPIHLAPLRERRDDIPLLADAFLKRRCLINGKRVVFSTQVLEKLYDYSWPGNVRQLENLVERLVALSKNSVIDVADLPDSWFAMSLAGQEGESKNNGRLVTNLDEEVLVGDRQLSRMEVAERSIIIEALNRHDGSASAAAEYLGLGQATIYRKIRSLDIPKSVLRGIRDE